MRKKANIPASWLSPHRLAQTSPNGLYYTYPVRACCYGCVASSVYKWVRSLSFP
jgi:hypothetical protein